MASGNALSTWDISVSQNVSKVSSEAEEIERVHTDAPEDLNTARVKPKLSEDTPPPSESSNIKNSLEISAVPKPNNLFEILIKKVESVNNSATEEVRSSTTENPKEQQTKNMNTKRAILTDPATNGNLSFTNGEASSENHEAENEKPNLLSHRRSIFVHLRKNFRILDESPRPTAEESSSKPDSLPTRPTCNNVTSSCAAKTKDVTMNQDADFPGERSSSSTAQVHMNSTTSDCSGFTVLESLNPSDNNHEVNHNDDGEFPFTKRLKWISQRSREGSPSLPQQQQIPTEAEQESLDNISNSTSYFVETSNKTNATASDSTRASVITAAHNSKPQEFQPLLNTSQSGSSNFGSISLRLQNGKTEMTQVSRVAQSMETGQIPSNEAYLVLESKPSRALEVNRSRISTNVPLKTQKENSRNLLAEKGQFHLLSENRQPSFSALRSPPSLTGSNLFVNGVRGTSEKNFINLNEQNVQFVNNEQKLQANQSHARQGSVDLSSTVYSKSPIHSKAFSPMWDHAVTSSIPIVNHRVPDSVPLCYGNGFSTASAFASPLYHPRSHGNPVLYGSQNPLFRSVQIQPRQGISFRPRFYQCPVVTGVPHAGQNVRSSTSEYMSKPPPPYTVNERLFRPVSPQWSQSFCTNNVCSATNSVAQVTKNEPTISDEDRDEFSYACALHESANSPDIERMLSSESPNENICSENLSSSNESSSKEPNVSIPKSSVQSLSSFRSTASGTARTRIYESPRSTCSEMARTSTSVTECSPKVDFLTSSQSCREVIKEIKKESLETCKKRKSESLDISKNEPKENKAKSTTEHKKRKMNLNVIHKRLKPKLPSPERETSSGDLYRDPSKLTREERALQRAMMQFSEMEMKEKVVPSLSKKKRVKESQTNKIKNTETQPVESKEKLASSTWLLKFKRKQRNWLTNRTKLVKKSSGFVKKISEEAPVKVEPQSSPDCNETEQNQNTKIKKRKKNAHDHDRTSKKHRKFTKEKSQNQMKEDFLETAAVEAKNAGDQDLDSQRDEQAKKKKKKFKKILEKRRKVKEHDITMTKQTKPDHVLDTDTLPGGTSNMPQSTAKKRKRSIDSSVERPHRIKTYMLVPSYQGFKDFQPVVMTSRTRNKKMVQPDDKDNSEDKPKVPLLVVESINSKPVKEMVVAESEEVQRLVTECLRVHGKWHGDELEQALKREEAKLNEEESKLRDAKRLTVNRTTGETILHKAARLGYDEVVKQCILRGADPNARDNAGWTPLHEACARGKLAVVRVLARYGANVNAPSNDGIRPIHDAAEAGHVNIIRVLLSYGADPVLATYAGNTALACAKDPKTRKFLREYCVDVGLDSPEYTQENTNGWDFTCSTRYFDNPYCSDHVSGIWEDIPSCTDSFVPEFEISDRPHLTTYNLPVLKDGVVVGRRNYLLVQEIYESGFIAKSTLQKKLKNIETREIPWSEFLETIAENHLCVKPSFSPEGSSKEEPKAQLIPLNYTIRKLLGIRIESCKW